MNRRALVRGIQLIVAITAVTFTYLGYRDLHMDKAGGLAGLLAVLSNLKPGWLVLAAVLALQEGVFGGLRIFVLARVLSKDLKARTAIVSEFVLMFCAGVTPGQAGAPPSQVAVLVQGGMRLVDVATASLLTAACTIIFFLTTAVGIFVLHETHHFVVADGTRIGLLLGASVGVFGAGLVALILCAAYPPLLKGVVRALGVPAGALVRLVLHGLARVARTRSWAEGQLAHPGQGRARLVHSVDEFHEGFRVYMRRGKRAYALAQLLTFGFFCSRFAVAYFILLALGLPTTPQTFVTIGPPLVQVVLVQALINFALYLSPTPGASGFAEATSTALMAPWVSGRLQPPVHRPLAHPRALRLHVRGRRVRVPLPRHRRAGGAREGGEEGRGGAARPGGGAGRGRRVSPRRGVRGQSRWRPASSTGETRGPTSATDGTGPRAHRRRDLRLQRMARERRRHRLPRRRLRRGGHPSGSPGNHRSRAGEPSPALFDEFVARVKAGLEAQAREEATWRERTINDRLDAAFGDLEARGIVTAQALGFTLQEGSALIDEMCADRGGGVRGSVFYHRQDLEHALDGEGLMLAFTGYGSDPGAEEAIGREIVHVLQHHGVPVGWNGSARSRIEVEPFVWQKRRTTKAPPAASAAPRRPRSLRLPWRAASARDVVGLPRATRPRPRCRAPARGVGRRPGSCYLGHASPQSTSCPTRRSVHVFRFPGTDVLEERRAQEEARAADAG